MLKLIPYPNKVTLKEGVLEKPYKINEIKTLSSLGEEGYKMTIDNDGVTIKAVSDKGLFYGKQTLKQLEIQYKNALPFLEIEDSPQYSYRGYMLDCVRHFFTVEEIKKQIDMLALLKINTFHWHLTDDQGWRIKSDKYPLLTEVGGSRKQTMGDGIKVEGYYSKEDIREIVDYCKQNYINVIPEIDIPGHFRAAIAAYPYLSCFQQKTIVGEGYGISPYIACAGKQSVYDFLYDLLDEILELFPYEYIHLGGDEALKLNWITCPDCQKTIQENNLKNEEELQGYFMTKMVKYLNGKGRKVINWNDGMLGGNIQGDIVVQYWKESKECKQAAYDEVKKGRKVIVSPFFSFYLDYPAGMTPLKKTYNYKIDINMEGNVWGLEAPLWTEHVENVNKLEEMTYPRLIAVAERNWTKRADYKSFLTRLKYFYKILDMRKIAYSKNPNPFFLKGKFDMIKFFVNALKKVDKENIKAQRATKKLLNQKYKSAQKERK